MGQTWDDPPDYHPDEDEDDGMDQIEEPDEDADEPTDMDLWYAGHGSWGAALRRVDILTVNPVYL